MNLSSISGRLLKDDETSYLKAFSAFKKKKKKAKRSPFPIEMQRKYMPRNISENEAGYLSSSFDLKCLLKSGLQVICARMHEIKH